MKNNNSTVWYNYDAFNRPLATITQVTEADFVLKKPNVDDQIKTSESDYNYFTGLVNNSTYQSNNPQETLELQMTYDANYRNTLTQLSYSGITQNLSANYYNKIGQVKRVVLGNNYQGLDYVYTLNGGLKAVNHPGLDPTLDPGHDNDNYGGGNSGVNQDLFGEIIEYYNNDYERSGTNMGSSMVSGSSRYNGLIYGVRYKTRDKVNAQTTGASYIDLGTSQTTLINTTNYGQQELRFAYEYDEFNRFGKSTFGLFNNSTGVFTSRTDYSEGGSSGYVGYDRNGNITGLKRQAYVQSGSLVTLDNLSYTNGSTNNRLTAITDAAVNSFASGVNFKTPSTSSSSAFTYNTIGQLTASPAENISSITYFPGGKPKKITFTNGNTSEFEYGANGQKIKAKLYNASSAKYKYTWYVGPYIYEYDQAVTPAVFHITEARVGGQLLRVPSGGDLHNAYLVFQLTDHLGNVRATFKGSGTGNGIEILSYADYYAFGGVMPGRNWTLEIDRYGYQGQEKAQDGTIWDQFELRAYNHDIGRWFTPDPYGQFASPYIAMANNPVSNIDPDGGQVPVFELGKEPRGLLEHKRERDGQSGVYAPLEVQKRYRDEIENIRKEYLVQGLGADIPGYLNAVKATNDLYCGLAEAFHWMGFGGVASGIDYLTQTQISNNEMLCWRNGMQSISVGMPIKPSEGEAEFGKDANVELGGKVQSTANEEGQPGQSKIAISGDGEVNPKAESTAKELPNSEGSESQTTYDKSGEKQNSESEKSLGEQSLDLVQPFNNQLTGNPVNEKDLNTFIDKHFADRISKMETKPSFIIDDDKVTDGAEASTASAGFRENPITVYLRQRNFSSEKMLYLVIDHELIHAELFSNGTYAAWSKIYGQSRAKELSETSASLQTYFTSKTLGFKPYFYNYFLKTAVDLSKKHNSN